MKNKFPAMEKQILTKVSGFTMASDELLKIYGPLTALVFGKALRYCRMKDGVCRASLKRLGEELGMSTSTIQRHIHKLVRDGYLKDRTPKLRNRPHLYADAGKIKLELDLKMTHGNVTGAKEIYDDDGVWAMDKNGKYTLKKK